MGAELLRGLAVEDADVAEAMEVSGHHLLGLAPVHPELRRHGDDEDLVLPLDVQADGCGVALAGDAGEGEVSEVGDLGGGDHCQVHHGVCPGHTTVTSLRSTDVHNGRAWCPALDLRQTVRLRSAWHVVHMMRASFCHSDQTAMRVGGRFKSFSLSVIFWRRHSHPSATRD